MARLSTTDTLLTRLVSFLPIELGPLQLCPTDRTSPAFNVLLLGKRRPAWCASSRGVAGSVTMLLVFCIPMSNPADLQFRETVLAERQTPVRI
jgi:hypothetical protein